MDDKQNPKLVSIRPAMYARVSCEQQTQQSTIDSQIESIKERVRTTG